MPHKIITVCIFMMIGMIGLAAQSENNEVFLPPIPEEQQHDDVSLYAESVDNRQGRIIGLI